MAAVLRNSIKLGQVSRLKAPVRREGYLRQFRTFSLFSGDTIDLAACCEGASALF